MKIAVLALTAAGRSLARRISGQYPGQVDLYFKEGYSRSGREHTFESLPRLVENLFAAYEGLVFIMAAGIVVRVISPFIRHKAMDPAVVALDEGGNFSISLLSGHLGGANDLAREIAALIGAVPVITTATDVQGRPAMELVARKLGLAVEPFQNLKFINGVLVNGGKLGIFTDMPKPLLRERCAELFADGIEILLLAEYPTQRTYFHAAVVMTDGVFPFPASPPSLFLRPPTLHVGVGCRRGTSAGAILEAVEQACALSGRAPSSVKTLATAWLKSEEEGLIRAGEMLKVPVKTFPREALSGAIARFGLPVSKYVEEQIGVGAVCEPAALLAAGQGKLILGKQRYTGITVAIATDGCPWWA